MVMERDNGTLVQAEAAARSIEVGIDRVEGRSFNCRSLGEKQPPQEPALDSQAATNANLSEPGTFLRAFPQRTT